MDLDIWERKDSQTGSQLYIRDHIPITISGHNDLEVSLSGKTPCILSYIFSGKS